MVKSIKILGVNLLIMLFGVVGIGMLSQFDSSQDATIYLNNVGATKCWKATCGHKSKTYTYPAYTVVQRSTAYHHGGTYLEPKATEQVTISGTFTQSMSRSGGVSAEVANASVGFSGGLSVFCSRSQSIPNDRNYRRYPHLGVEFERRTNVVTIKKRTYNPTWHMTATNRYCEFQSTKEGQSCKMKVSVGLSLLDTKRNDF